MKEYHKDNRRIKRKIMCQRDERKYAKPKKKGRHSEEEMKAYDEQGEDEVHSN